MDLNSSTEDNIHGNNLEITSTKDTENGTQNYDDTVVRFHDKVKHERTSSPEPPVQDGNPMRSTGNVFLDISREKQLVESYKKSSDHDLDDNDEEENNEVVQASAERTYATGVVSMQDKSGLSVEDENTRDELIRKIEELEKQRKSLRQKQLIKEIQALQTEVHSNVHDENTSFGSSGAPVIANNTAPIATGITPQSTIDIQLKELNEKIDKTSKYMDEKRKTEDLSQLTTEELQLKVQELKSRKELLSKFRQKATVISLIQDLHQQVSTMKGKVKRREDEILSRDCIKIYALSPSEIDVYWNQNDFPEVKSYTLFYRHVPLKKDLQNNSNIGPYNVHDEEDDAVFLDVHPDIYSTSIVIENLRPGTEYEIKLEGVMEEGYKITTELATVTTFKPVSGHALILANYANFKLPYLKDLVDIQTDIYSLKEQLEHFSFDVDVRENVTAEDLIQSVEQFSEKLDLETDDCFLCVVTGYMYNGYMYGNDGLPVLLHDLFGPLRITDKTENGQPETGKGKVKLILVDAFKVRENVIEELDESLQPRAVQFRSSSKNSLEASWKRPKLTKRKLKGFKVTIESTSMSNSKLVLFNQQKDNYFYKFTKLETNTEYNLEICAVFADGHTGKSVKATMTTFESEPSQPRKLSVEAVSTTQIYVYWIPPVLTDRTIIGYKVSLRDRTREEHVQQMTSYTCHVFTDLKEDTEYNISVTTVIKGEVIDLDVEVKDEESKPVYIDITTLMDRTPNIMSGPTVQYVLEEPDFLIASATASAFLDNPTSSFLNTFKRHLSFKFEKKDIQSILEDVKKEIISSTDNYDIPQSVSTLQQPVFFGFRHN